MSDEKVWRKQTQLSVSKSSCGPVQGSNLSDQDLEGRRVKLVELFEAEKPGILLSIVTEGHLATELSADPQRFLRSKAIVGDVLLHTLTHRSMNSSVVFEKLQKRSASMRRATHSLLRTQRFG